MKDEADLLFAKSVPIIEINNNINFIHSFEEDNGKIIINKPKPPCRLRENGLCAVYDIRPLVCRMYPIGFAAVNNDIGLVLYQDCKFSRELLGNIKNEFVHNVLSILYSVPAESMNEIIETYRLVDAISSFPEGPNLFEVLVPAWKNNNERR
jgi:Fe-S-cluster containining protein